MITVTFQKLCLKSDRDHGDLGCGLLSY